MKIEDVIIEKYVTGWVVRMPYDGKDKDGNTKTHYKDAYFPRLDQCLRHIRDNSAKACESAEELISLLKSAEDTDQRVLAASGLTDNPRVIPA